MANELPAAVEIKGYGTDVNIILSAEAPFPDVEAELIKRLGDSDQFFSGLAVVVDAGDRVLSAEECDKLKDILADKFNLTVSSVRSQSKQTREVAERIGWNVDATKREKEKVKTPGGRQNDTILVKRTLRSGQKEWHQGNIVILGDVNPGAEVVATGDVVIIGTLRGVAHAGAEGSDSAVIIAVNLRPIQLRIAGYIGRSPDLDLKRENVPEMARVEDGNIVIDKLG